MIALRGRAKHTNLHSERAVWLLVEQHTLTPQRRGRAFLLNGEKTTPKGFELYISPSTLDPPSELPHVQLPPELDYLASGDVLSTGASGERLRVLWRAKSNQNALLLTERCDHYCLMCSQPPRQIDDDHRLAEAFELVRLLPRTTRDISFTGGEPTLYGEQLLQLLQLCGRLLPEANVHVLSNGRRFGRLEFAKGWAAVDNPNLMVGIPIYGTEPSLHDYVVQSAGAFDETVRGILNLAALEQRIEIRVVVHQQTAPYLVEIAEFISRNLPFVEQVAWMGLEMIGLARANIETVWIDPVDYQQQLTQAVRLLDHRRIKTMIYNHQLCLLDRGLWPFAVKSISDWKNEYHPECLRCDEIDACGGFFFSAKYRMSQNIHAIRRDKASGPARMLLQIDA